MIEFDKSAKNLGSCDDGPEELSVARIIAPGAPYKTKAEQFLPAFYCTFCSTKLFSDVPLVSERTCSVPGEQ